MEGLDNAVRPEAPATPNRADNASPDIATAQPQPRRAFPSQMKQPGAQGVMPPSPWGDSPWSGGEAGTTRELSDIWGAAGGDGKQAPMAVMLEHGSSRPLSSVSTSAGMTPSPDSRLRSSAQDGFGSFAGASSGLQGVQQQLAMQPKVAGAPRGTPSPVKEAPGAPSQSRKIFVGGIPQEMTQEDLHKVFSDHWVKKAWLQQCRVGTNGSNASFPPRNHRGFGFVIFYDTNAIDQILGTQESKFIRLKDGKFEGKQLEVKRAVSSNDIKVTGGKPADQPSFELQASSGLASMMPEQRQPACPSQVAPWPTGTLTPVDQHSTAAAAWPPQQAQSYFMCPYQLPSCGGVQQVMPQMPQVMHAPYQQVGPCGSFPAGAPQGPMAPAYGQQAGAPHSPFPPQPGMQQHPQMLQAPQAMSQQPQAGYAPPLPQQQLGHSGCFPPAGQVMPTSFAAVAQR